MYFVKFVILDKDNKIITSKNAFKDIKKLKEKSLKNKIF